jgi:DNA-binding NarL/FixJ family response regulator
VQPICRTSVDGGVDSSLMRATLAVRKEADSCTRPTRGTVEVRGVATTGQRTRSTGNGSTRQLRIVIAEGGFLAREALSRILSEVDSVEVAATCRDRDSLLAAIAEHRPQAIVTDIRMPPTGTDEGIQVARTLRRSGSRIGVVVLSQFAEPEHLVALLESGAAGRAYLLTDRIRDSAQLVSAIEAVAAGESVIDPLVVESLARSHLEGPRSHLTDLTPREHDVLAEIAQGKSNAAVAESLHLSRRAVEKHINSVFMKLELGNPDEVSRRVKATLAFLADEGLQ